MIDLGRHSLAAGAHLALKAALRDLSADAELEVRGADVELGVHLTAWARRWGSPLRSAGSSWFLGAPIHMDGRWRGAERAGEMGSPEGVDTAPRRWGLAARGAAVELGTPAFDFLLVDRDMLWTGEAGRIYLQAAAAQWDPVAAIDWSAPMDHPPEVEDALVQVMTFLIENELAALAVPARFCAQVHPFFREIVQVLAIQAADEARHVEVFTRRIAQNGRAPGLSTAGGQASLKSLVDEPDFALAAFLTSVLGEGTFLSLLRFIERHAPDPTTRQMMRLVAADEARHVAFGLAHLEAHAARDPSLRSRLQNAVERRHDALASTSGLNEEVYDALVVLAAGGLQLEGLARGHAAVVELLQEMDQLRQLRLLRLGFSAVEARELSSLHTRNFM